MFGDIIKINKYNKGAIGRRYSILRKNALSKVSRVQYFTSRDALIRVLADNEIAYRKFLYDERILLMCNYFN